MLAISQICDYKCDNQERIKVGFSITSDENDEDENNDGIRFDMNRFVEHTRLLNLPQLTTSILNELSPKLLVYNYIVNVSNPCEYTDCAYRNNQLDRQIAHTKAEYSWILTKETFNEAEISAINKYYKFPVFQMIQDVEKSYNELYGILSEYKNPNGLLK